MKREPLPIDSAIPRILESFEKHPNLVIQAEPGTGKTTRVPPALLKASWRKPDFEILVLEPRRLAAKLAARRVAEEMGEQVGKTVGYQFRFENVSSPATRVRYLTEGMLMRRLLSDPGLRGVSAVLLDEFHERHLHTDTAIAYLKKLQAGERPDLRIGVMSATLEMESVARYLGAQSIEVPGKRFDVELRYLPGLTDKSLEYGVRTAAEEGLKLEGDILVFLPGMAEIRACEQALSGVAARGARVLPLHGELSREEQDEAVHPDRSGKRKIVLSTNVAETSLTIPGIRIVIDSGLARVASYSWWTGLPALKTRPISRASAIQRAGRAGRTAPGACLRLYSKGDFEGRAPFEVPEIRRADLSQTLLELLALGVRDLDGFPWFEAPSADSLSSSRELLRKLSAISESRDLTEIGRELAGMPIHPRLGRLAIAARDLGHAEDGARLAAFLSENRATGEELIESFLRLGKDAFVERVAERLLSALKRKPAPARAGKNREEALRFSVLTGFPDRVAARRQAGDRHAQRIELVFSSGGSAELQNSSAVSGRDYFVAVDVMEKKYADQARGKVQLKQVCGIEPDWLLDLVPSGVESREELSWNPARERVESVSRMTYGELVLSEEKGPPSDSARAAELLVSRLRAGAAGSPDPDAYLASIVELARLKTLRERLALIGQSALDPAAIQEALSELASGMTSLSELRQADFLSFLVSRLPPGTAELLDRQAPEHVTLARGRRVRVNYEPGKPPWIESRLQDFLGMRQGPAILGGKLKLTLHLLAPNQRALQVTNDLESFWRSTYKEVRTQLMRRYPRHSWPEDPLANDAGNAKR